MGYRVTDPDKWHKDKWFRKLRPLEKLAFLYLVDNCNIGGFWEKDLDMMAYSIRADEDDLEGAIQGLSKKVVECDGWLWVQNFIKHQKNLPLNHKNNAHKGIINRLEEQVNRFEHSEIFLRFLADNGLKELLVEVKNKGADKGLISPTGKGNSKSKGNSKGSSYEKGECEGEKQIAIPDRKAFHEYGHRIGMIPAYLEHIYDSLMSRGWKDGNGHLIEDWQAYLRMKFKYQHRWIQENEQSNTSDSTPKRRNNRESRADAYFERNQEVIGQFPDADAGDDPL